MAVEAYHTIPEQDEVALNRRRDAVPYIDGLSAASAFFEIVGHMIYFGQRGDDDVHIPVIANLQLSNLNRLCDTDQ